MGPSGAGKTSQARQLALNDRRYVHIEVGELLRQSTDTEIGRLLAAGELVGDSLVAQMITDKISAINPSKTALLDGFPRRLSQVLLFERMLEEIGREIKAVIILKVSQATAQARLSKRGRADDVAATIARKYQIYQTETAKVVEYFRDQGLVHEVDGEASLNEVDMRIKEVLANR